jgi:hypothetical protein
MLLNKDAPIERASSLDGRGGEGEEVSAVAGGGGADDETGEVDVSDAGKADDGEAVWFGLSATATGVEVELRERP